VHLTPEEKREMLADGLDQKRGEDFRTALRMRPKKRMTFDEYLAFLNDVQEVFGAFHRSRKPTITKRNRL